MRRLSILVIALCICSGLGAQKVQGPFSFADHMMSSSFLGHAGKKHIKVDPPKPTQFSFSTDTPVAHVSADRDFIEYLLSSGLKSDALTLLSEKPYYPSDTLEYLAGLALFEDRQFQGAALHFCRSRGGFSAPAAFLGSYSQIHAGNLDEARGLLTPYLKGEYGELASLQLAGISLIQKDYETCRKAVSSFTYSDHRLADSETTLRDMYSTVSRRKKSALAAACLSAVIPGAGKVYAGRTGEGAAAFMTVVPLGIITAEQWKKNGPGYWGTTLSGALFSLFYIGNIYGSYVSVGVQEQVIADEVKALVMYNLHIPLRSCFR